MSCFFDNGVQHSLVILLIQNFHYYWNAFFLPYQKARTWDPGRPQQGPTKTRKLGVGTPVRPQEDPTKTGKLGPRTLVGTKHEPTKTKKTATRDPSGTLQKPENLDLSRTLQKPENPDLGPQQDLTKKQKFGTWDPTKTGTPMRPSENLKSGMRYHTGILRLEQLVLM